MTRARDVADNQENLGGGVPPFVAGKNKIINGDFGVWQRGTSGFTFGGAFNADRWKYYYDGAGPTATITQQALTAGSIVGVDSPFCFQWSQTVAGSGATTNQLYQLVENVQTFAGQTTVLSFYAKSDATRTAVAPTVNQNFGSGGSATVGATVTAVSGNPTNLTTSWQRFSYTVALASITGKTVGTSSYLEVSIKLPINTTQVTQIVGVQLESGSVATPFTTATGTIQGELAACQRYFCRLVNGANNANEFVTTGMNYSTSQSILVLRYPFQMRATPTISFSNQTHFALYASNAAASATTGIVADFITSVSTRLSTTVSGVPFLGGNATLLLANNSSATLDASAEL